MVRPEKLGDKKKKRIARSGCKMMEDIKYRRFAKIGSGLRNIWSVLGLMYEAEIWVQKYHQQQFPEKLRGRIVHL